MRDIKNKIALKIACMLPKRILLWAFIVASSLDPQGPGKSYERIYKIIVKKYNLKGGV